MKRSVTILIVTVVWLFILSDKSRLVYAYTDSAPNVINQEITIAGSQETSVYAELGSEYEVIIPKSITLDGEEKTGSYTVTVVGDIASNEYISVIPDDFTVLSSAKIADTTAVITQDKTDWYCHEISNSNSVNSEGVITATGISAGTWEGTLNFNITMHTHEHNYTETITKTATCTEDGVKLLECACGNTTTEVIAATGHNYADSTCTNCGATSHTHSYTETVIKEATCLADGEKTLVCECGDSYTETISILDHDYDNGICRKCGTIDSTLHSHDYTESIVKEATCTIEGEKIFTCACGASYTEAIPVTEHNYTDGVCSECGAIGGGLYDSETGELKVSWGELVANGFDITKDYTNTAGTDYFKTNSSSGYTFFQKYNIGGKLVIPEGITKIGSNALAACAVLTDIIFPQSLMEFGAYSLQGCTGLSQLEIPDNMVEVSGGAFYGCSGLTSVEFHSSLQTIDDEAFRFCTGLTEISVPSSVSYIGDTAFAGCTNLSTLNIPKAALEGYVGANAFYNTAWLNNMLSANNNYVIVDNVLVVAYPGSTVSVPSNVTRIASNAFNSYSTMKNITIPDSVVSIGQSAFNHCTALKTVTIPDSVVSIEDGAFSSCTALRTVTLPEGLVNIEDYAFLNCTGYLTLTIPDSVTSIGNSAFYGCSSANITLPSDSSSLVTIGERAFYKCAKYILAVPSTVENIGSDAFYGCHITYNGTATGSPWGASSIN